MTPSTSGAPARALVQRYGGRAFADATVEDVMMNGIVTCRPETSLVDAARMMVGYGIHCLVVSHVPYDGSSQRWGVISDLDLIAAAGTDKNAGQAARTDVVPVPSNAPLERAAKRMVDHGVHHLVVVDPGTAHPVGVVSTTGIAHALAVTSTQPEVQR